MEVSVYSLDGTAKEHITLPSVFLTEYRPDLIRRVFVALQSHSFQPKGRSPTAGKKTSAVSWGVGRGVSRVPRVKGERYSRAGQAAGIAGVVKGRVAHPPKTEKRIHKRVNKKERIYALKSAIAATMSKEIVGSRGHRVENLPALPIVVEDEIQRITRTSELVEFMEKVGLSEELKRLRESEQRVSGVRCKRKTRRKRIAVGPLIVVGKDEGISLAARNIKGVETVPLSSLSVLHLSPGAHPARLTIWSKSAISQLDLRMRSE